jgi:hypothetical protein
MPHKVKKLSAILVGKLSSPGYYGDGDGLTNNRDQSTPATDVRGRRGEAALAAVAGMTGDALAPVHQLHHCGRDARLEQP